MIEFSDVFKMPLKLDEHGGMIVWTSDGRRAFDFLQVDEASQRKIVDTINGVSDKRANHNLGYVEGEVRMGKLKLLRVRGWDYMANGLNLPPEEAARLQDEFGRFIVNRISKEKNDE